MNAREPSMARFIIALLTFGASIGFGFFLALYPVIRSM